MANGGTDLVRPQAGFSATSRVLGEEDRIVLTTVGIDIGSATCHVVFSRVEMRREGVGYTLSRSEVLHESPVTLTPYRSGNEIDEAALREHISRQYAEAGVRPDEVDTGAVILTGVALLRRNARAIGDIFSAEAGKFVAVGAGDNLEGTLAAHGSGAVKLSRTAGSVLNIDIGGGTTKVALCRSGAIAAMSALDIGGRLVAYDDAGRIVRLEPAAARISERLGLGLTPGATFTAEQGRKIATFMVDELFAETSVGGAGGRSTLLRDAGLPDRSDVAVVTFSGGVSEYVHERSEARFGDLGPFIGAEIRVRLAELGAPVHVSTGGIRATVIGAAQYSIQVSGSTIYVSDPGLLPIRNVPVVAPAFDWSQPDLDEAAVARSLTDAIRRLDLDGAATAVAIGVDWAGSATYARLDAFCTGILRAMEGYLAKGYPLILVCGRDIGGLVGLHVVEEMAKPVPIVSIDAVALNELDHVDIGEFIAGSGSVPVLVKSLLFASAGVK